MRRLRILSSSMSFLRRLSVEARGVMPGGEEAARKLTMELEGTSTEALEKLEEKNEIAPVGPPERLSDSVADLLYTVRPEWTLGERRWSYEQKLPSQFVDFRFLRNWEEVERVVEALGHNFNGYHAAAAFSRLRFVPLPPASMLQRLAEKSAPLVHDMTPYHLLATLHSAVRVGTLNSDFLEDVASTLMASSKPFNIVTYLLTNAMFSIAVSRKRRSCHEAPLHASPSFPSEAPFIDFLLDVISSEDRLKDFTDADCARVIYTLSQFRHLTEKYHDIFEAVCDRLSQPDFIERVNESSSVLILSSLTAIRRRPMTLLMKLSTAMTQAGSMGMYQNQELVTIVYCLGALDHWNPLLIKMVLTELLKPDRLEALTEQGLANVLYGLAKFPNIHDIDRDAYVLPFFKEATRANRLMEYMHLGLTAMLYTVGLMEYPKGDQAQVLVPLIEALVEPHQLKAASTQGLVTAVWGIGKIQFKDKRLLDHLFEECIRPERLNRFSCQGLSLLVYTCGVLGYRNSKVLQQLLRRASEMMTRMTGPDICHLAYGVGRTNCVTVEAVKPLLTECRKPTRCKSLETQHLCNIIQMGTILGIKTTVLLPIKMELLQQHRLKNMDAVELQEAMLGLNRDHRLMGRHIQELMDAALQEKILSQSGAAQLSTFATVMAMNLPRLHVTEEQINRFAKEVTSPVRLEAFNPIDTTSIYTTLIRYGIHDQEILMRVLDALDKKRPSPKRRAGQLLGALAATNIILDTQLRSALLEALLQHIFRPECMTVFTPFDAFTFFVALVGSDPAEAARSIWDEALQTFSQIAKEGDLSLVRDRLLDDAMHQVTQSRHRLPRTLDLKWIVDIAAEEARLRNKSPKAMLPLIEGVASFDAVQFQYRTKTLKTMLEVHGMIDRLGELESRTAVRLLTALQDMEVLSTERWMELATAAGIEEKYKEEARERARNLEGVVGLRDD